MRLETEKISTQVLSVLTYPESNGEPIASNTKQFEEIVALKAGPESVLSDAFVARDLLWYPIEGRPDIRLAPDVLVAFGRPGGHRSSYRQWEDGGSGGRRSCANSASIPTRSKSALFFHRTLSGFAFSFRVESYKNRIAPLRRSAGTPQPDDLRSERQL